MTEEATEEYANLETQELPELTVTTQEHLLYIPFIRFIYGVVYVEGEDKAILDSVIKSINDENTEAE